MTNNILDVLTFMFDFLFDSAEQDSTHELDDDLLKTHLSEAGFDSERIEKALIGLRISLPFRMERLQVLIRFIIP